MESAALVAPLTHHPFVSKSQAPSGWNLLQQVAPLTHLAPVTHHRTVVGTCHWWVTGRRPNSLEYQICTAPEPFDTLVTGLTSPAAIICSPPNTAAPRDLLYDYSFCRYRPLPVVANPLNYQHRSRQYFIPGTKNRPASTPDFLLRPL